MPRRRENLADEFSLVAIVVEYGDSHGGSGKVLRKVAIVNYIYQVSTLLIPK
jgi:hypothetical protein